MLIKAKRKRARDGADDGQVRARLTRTRLWLIDMDDTLYEASAGAFAAIHVRMEAFIAKRLDLPLEEAARVQHDYWKRYGATFLGLDKHHGIAPEEFLSATHRFDLKPHIHARVSGRELRQALAHLPGKKVVLTNGPACYAESVLTHLGVRDMFDGLVSADDMHRLGRWRCKPDAQLFASVCAQFGVKPQATTLVEDSPANLKCAKTLGMHTVWCAGYRKKEPHRTHAHPWADRVVTDLADLARALTHARQIQ